MGDEDYKLGLAASIVFVASSVRIISSRFRWLLNIFFRADWSWMELGVRAATPVARRGSVSPCCHLPKQTESNTNKSIYRMLVEGCS